MIVRAYECAAGGTYWSSYSYVNDPPHVGFALELVQADAYARHFRLLGHDVRFQCGTDDNSLKNVRCAEAVGLPVQEFVTKNADRFEHLGERLDISNGEFVRASRDPRRVGCVHALWNACAAKQDLYRKAYEGLFAWDASSSTSHPNSTRGMPKARCPA